MESSLSSSSSASSSLSFSHSSSSSSSSLPSSTSSSSASPTPTDSSSCSTRDDSITVKSEGAPAEAEARVWTVERQHLLNALTKWKRDLDAIERIHRGPPKAADLARQCADITKDIHALQRGIVHPSLLCLLHFMRDEWEHDDAYWRDRVLRHGDFLNHNALIDLNYAANTIRLETLHWTLGYATGVVSLSVPVALQPSDLVSASQSMPIRGGCASGVSGTHAHTSHAPDATQTSCPTPPGGPSSSSPIRSRGYLRPMPHVRRAAGLLLPASAGARISGSK